MQAAAERVLYGGMKLMNAKGATSVLMGTRTEKILVEGGRVTGIQTRQGAFEAPIVVMDEGVIFDGNCRIKPKEAAASQTARMPLWI